MDRTYLTPQQAERCRAYAKANNLIVLKTFSDDAPASSHRPPAMNAMLDFPDAKRKPTTVIIVDDLMGIGSDPSTFRKHRNALNSVSGVIKSATMDLLLERFPSFKPKPKKRRRPRLHDPAGLGADPATSSTLCTLGARMTIGPSIKCSPSGTRGK